MQINHVYVEQVMSSLTLIDIEGDHSNIYVIHSFETSLLFMDTFIMETQILPDTGKQDRHL